MSIKILLLNLMYVLVSMGLSALGEHNQETLKQYLATEEIGFSLQDDGAHIIFEHLDIKIPTTLYVWNKFSILSIDLTERLMPSTAPSMMNSLATFSYRKNMTIPMKEALLAFAKQLKIILTCDIDRSLDVRMLIGEIHRQPSMKEKYILLMAHSFRTKNIQTIKDHFEEISSAFGQQKSMITAIFNQFFTCQPPIN